MADSSFDIVSEINLQEMDNAVVQAQKEVGTRYDFKGTSASVGDLNKKDKEITLTAESEAQPEEDAPVLDGIPTPAPFPQPSEEPAQSDIQSPPPPQH